MGTGILFKDDRVKADFFAFLSASMGLLFKTARALNFGIFIGGAEKFAFLTFNVALSKDREGALSTATQAFGKSLSKI